MAKFETLTDNFGQGTFDTNKWEFEGSDDTASPTICTVTGKGLKMDLEPDGIGWVRSKNKYDLTDSIIYCHEVTPFSSDVNVYFTVCDSDWSRDIGFDIWGGWAVFYACFGESCSVGELYELKGHPILGIKEQGGKVYSGILERGREWVWTEEFQYTGGENVNNLHFEWYAESYTPKREACYLSSVNTLPTPYINTKYPLPAFGRS